MISNNTEGKVVITGASGGLGEAISRLFYAQGASVVLGRRLLNVLTKLNRKTLHWLAPPTPYQQVLTAPLGKTLNVIALYAKLNLHIFLI